MKITEAKTITIKLKGQDAADFKAAVKAISADDKIGFSKHLGDSEKAIIKKINDKLQ